MLGVAKSAARALHLYLMRRRQFDNEALRRHFRTRYQVDVGLYSYGCFHPWRMRGPMKVGRYCSIANTVITALDNHPSDALTTHPALYERAFGVVDQDHQWTGHLEIEDDVWIGHNAIVLSGCKRIGRGAIVGAGAIVTRDVERYAVVAGNPARKLRDRFPPALIEAIEASRWWELSLEDLRKVMAEDPELLRHPTAEAVRDWTARRTGSVPPAAEAPRRRSAG